MKRAKHYTLAIAEEGIETMQRVLLTPLGRGHYRVEETALSETPVFYHDTIEAVWRLGLGLRFRRVVEKSGLRVYRFLCSQEMMGSEALRIFQERVLEHGGYWEGICGGILIIHLPRGSACKPKSEMRAIVHSLNDVAV